LGALSKREGINTYVWREMGGGRAGDLGRIGVVVMYDTSSTFKFSVVWCTIGIYVCFIVFCNVGYNRLYSITAFQG